QQLSITLRDYSKVFRKCNHLARARKNSHRDSEVPMSRSLLRSLAVVLILFANCLLQAQSTGGRIVGQVTDTSGAVVPGAKITLTNEATGVEYNSQSGGSGDFSVLQLPVGVYTVSADHGSFKKYVRKGVRLE